MRIMVFLTLCLDSRCAGIGGRCEGQVFLQEGRHMGCSFGEGFVAEGTGF